MRVRVMMVAMPVIIGMRVVSIGMTMIMIVRMRWCISTFAIAFTGASYITEFAFSFGTQAFHVVVVTFLRQTDLSFKPKNLLAVFAELAVHVVSAFEDLVDALLHGINDLGWSFR